jgi:hypothetical protein
MSSSRDIALEEGEQQISVTKYLFLKFMFFFTEYVSSEQPANLSADGLQPPLNKVVMPILIQDFGVQ